METIFPQDAPPIDMRRAPLCALFWDTQYNTSLKNIWNKLLSSIYICIIILNIVHKIDH